MHQAGGWNLATLGASLAFCLGACATTVDMDAEAQAAPSAAVLELLPEAIIARAHAAAGGDTWVRPRSLYMEGYGLFWRDGPQPVRHDPHLMWRVYPDVKRDAHQADGKVRIDSMRDGAMVFQVSFDGATTYNQDGPIPDAPDSDQWSSAFGFGVIRHALDDGFRLERLADDLVDGRAVHVVRVIAPEGRETLFAVAQDDAAILRVGFDTPRGWHERIYSNFFSNPGVDWVQPGRVRLFYNGVKSNEIIWTAFDVNAPISDEVFVIDAP